MIRVLISFALLIALNISCSDYEDYFESQNKIPVITLNNNAINESANIINDTIKVGFSKTFLLKVKDEEVLKPSITQTKKDSIRYNAKEDQFTVISKGEYENEILVKVNDSFKKESSVKIILHSFKNLPPVAKLTITGNESVELDARQSFDKDASFGGKIVRYVFSCNGFIIDDNLSKINYVFETSGLKLIKLKVQDNEGIWSDEISINHIVY